MTKRKSGVTRRELLRGAGMALAAGALPVSCTRRAARRKTLRIIQWSHYVPGYDRWFDGVFTKEWRAKNGIDVVVDHISATEVAQRGAAEAATGKGHDLFHFLSPPAAFERQAIDHADVVAEIETGFSIVMRGLGSSAGIPRDEVTSSATPRDSVLSLDFLQELAERVFLAVLLFLFFVEGRRGGALAAL